jgi:hypothetical protein
MYDAIENAGWIAAPYFVAVFFLLNTLLLNIVVSILIDNCQEGGGEDDEKEVPKAESLDDDTQQKVSTCPRL